MSGGAVTAIIVGLLMLDIAVFRFEILWHKPEKRATAERVESKVMLVLAAACLPAIAYALSQGRLWTAATCAFCAFAVLGSYRRSKLSLARELSPTIEGSAGRFRRRRG
jgi:hypothetical protein